MNWIDLHTHSTCSDGSESPTQVVRLAAEAGLSAFALTDHDTLEGIPEARRAGENFGVEVVAGVELSLPHEDGTFHMIALDVDPEHEGLLDVARRLRNARGPRNAGILAKLNALGIEITEEDVRAQVTDGDAADAVVARPHIARALVRKGVVPDGQAAFDRYLGRGAPAYVERERVSFEDAVAATHAAGGATVLCHPFTLSFRTPKSHEKQEALLEWLRARAAEGLDAMETRYGSYTAADEIYWQRIADETGLLTSGGSDFHGTMKPEVKVGRGRGRMRVPETVLDALRKRCSERATNRPG